MVPFTILDLFVLSLFNKIQRHTYHLCDCIIDLLQLQLINIMGHIFYSLHTMKISERGTFIFIFIILVLMPTLTLVQHYEDAIASRCTLKVIYYYYYLLIFQRGAEELCHLTFCSRLALTLLHDGARRQKTRLSRERFCPGR